MIMIEREIHAEIIESINNFPAVGILGPRQCGKTTLSKEIISKFKHAIYLDLELSSDLKKLEDPEFYLNEHKGKLICLDEIQRKPDLFPLLRALIDQDKRPSRFLILGSASQDLIRQSTESLAGRIDYFELTPFTRSELKTVDETVHWTRGGYPSSVLSKSDKMSSRWRNSFIKTFLERDLGLMGLKLSPSQMNRFWTMTSHMHSSILNKANLASSLGTSAQTIQNWIDVFEQTFMIRVLKPYSTNTRKRLVKSPKIYQRDSGILHTLLDIEDFDDLMGHPMTGPSWEGFAIENILNEMNGWNASYYRTSHGAEVDLIIEKGRKKIAVEFKLSSSPKIEKGTHLALDDLGINMLHVVVPKGPGEKVKQNIKIDSIETFLSDYL